MQGKRILGLHVNYDGMFRGGTKGWKREVFRIWERTSVGKWKGKEIKKAGHT